MCACSAEMSWFANSRLCTRLTPRNTRTTAFASEVRKRSSCIRDKYLVYEVSMQRETLRRFAEQLRDEVQARKASGARDGMVASLVVPASRDAEPPLVVPASRDAEPPLRVPAS